MKKILIVFVLLTVSQTIAQIEISSGMGVNFAATPSLKNYLNSNFNSGNSELKTFSAQVEFYGEGVYSVTKKFQIGVDYGVSIYSYNNFSVFNYELSFTMYKPSIVAYYVISGEGYKFKFGGGGGVRFVNLDEKILSTTSYKGTGFGFLTRAEGHTRLGGGFYAMIAADIRYDIIGEVSNGNLILESNKIVDPPDLIIGSPGDKVNINTFSVGVKLGISYFF